MSWSNTCQCQVRCLSPPEFGPILLGVAPCKASSKTQNATCQTARCFDPRWPPREPAGIRSTFEPRLHWEIGRRLPAASARLCAAQSSAVSLSVSVWTQGSRQHTLSILPLFTSIHLHFRMGFQSIGHQHSVRGPVDTENKNLNYVFLFYL